MKRLDCLVSGLVNFIIGTMDGSALRFGFLSRLTADFLTSLWISLVICNVSFAAEGRAAQQSIKISVVIPPSLYVECDLLLTANEALAPCLDQARGVAHTVYLNNDNDVAVRDTSDSLLLSRVSPTEMSLAFARPSKILLEAI